MQPETVDEAVEWLITVLEDRHKMLLTIMREDELIDLHFGLGPSIRNAFGLHDADSKLRHNCGIDNPDDASGVRRQLSWPDRIASNNNQTTGEPPNPIRPSFNFSATSHFKLHSFEAIMSETG
jgi:hypothetical protein